MTAYFIVRAEVPEAERDAFDRWYETEHLPDAKTAFLFTRVGLAGWCATHSGCSWTLVVVRRIAP